MGEGKHESTPWYVIPNTEYRGAYCGITNKEDEEWVVAVHGFARATNANARFIVRAVNSHAQLVQALKSARCTLIKIKKPGLWKEIVAEDLSKIDAALKAAEEGL